MARPTTDKKAQTLILRVNEETKEKIVAEAKTKGISISDYVRERVLGESVIQKEEEKKEVPSDSVIQNNLMDKAVERDLVDMCRVSGISTHDFFRGVCELWNDGEIGIDGERVKSLGHYNIERLVELCHIMNIKPQEAIDKITRSMEKGV